jgi:hypothetical protein
MTDDPDDAAPVTSTDDRREDPTVEIRSAQTESLPRSALADRLPRKVRAA